MVTIKAKRFILRPFKKGDEDFLRKNINDIEIYNRTCRIPYPYSRKHAIEFVKTNSKPNIKAKKELNFAIDIDGKVIGGIGFRDMKTHRAEVGYWLGKKYWNKGIISEALRLITNFGFKKLKLRRVYAIVFTKNKPSAKVLEKNNYKLEGTMRKYTLKDGKLIDVLLYAKVK
ncbi:GNAT family N-acetyltransferase [Candidatus Woesearchaeota archaeon]|nr:GNAT family N-acetyltransferase [Candidatus Woesearchaeota archaeon]